MLGASDQMSVRIADMNSSIPALVRNRYKIMRIVGATIRIIGVSDCGSVWMLDLGDLTDAVGGIATGVISGMIWVAIIRTTGVGYSIDIPLRIVMEPSFVPVKIGVIEEHLRGRTARNCRAHKLVAALDMQFGVVERAAAVTIATCLGEVSLHLETLSTRKRWRQRRID